MENQNLARRQTDLSAPSRTSLTASQQAFALELNLTAQNAKAEPARELVAELERILAHEEPDAIQWVFRRHRDQSPFFPSIFELKALLGMWRSEQEYKRQRAEAKELQVAREQGLLVSMPEVVQQLKDIAKSMPQAITSKHLAEIQRRAALIEEAPAVNFTAEQIRARRAREQKEIAEYAVNQ